MPDESNRVAAEFADERLRADATGHLRTCHGFLFGNIYTGNERCSNRATLLAARWNAVLDALAEYDTKDSLGMRPVHTADRMADILRNALNT